MSCTDLAVSFPARGVIRLSSHALFGDTDSPTCRRFIERELMTVLGVEKYKTGSITCSVQVDYDPRELTRDQMVEILDSALDNAEHLTKLDKLDLYTRRLRRPIDGPTRAAIANEYSRRRHEIPVPTEPQWHPDRPQFTIQAQWLSFVVRFTHDVIEVDAELSLAAKAFATQKHRQNAVRFIDSIANDLGL